MYCKPDIVGSDVGSGVDWLVGWLVGSTGAIQVVC